MSNWGVSPSRWRSPSPRPSGSLGASGQERAEETTSAGKVQAAAAVTTSTISSTSIGDVLNTEPSVDTAKSSKKRSRDSERQQRYAELFHRWKTLGTLRLGELGRTELHTILWALGEVFTDVAKEDAKLTIAQHLQLGGVWPPPETVPLASPRTRNRRHHAETQSAGIVLPYQGVIASLAHCEHQTLVSELAGAKQPSDLRIRLRGCEFFLMDMVKDLWRIHDDDLVAPLQTLEPSDIQQLRCQLQHLLAVARSASNPAAICHLLLPSAVVDQDLLRLKGDRLLAAQQQLEEAKQMLQDVNFHSFFGTDRTLSAQCRVEGRLSSLLRLRKARPEDVLSQAKAAYDRLQHIPKAVVCLRLRASTSCMFGIAFRWAGRVQEALEPLAEGFHTFKTLNETSKLEWAFGEYARALVACGHLETLRLLLHDGTILHEPTLCSELRRSRIFAEYTKELLYRPHELFRSDLAAAGGVLKQLDLVLQRAMQLRQEHAMAKVMCPCDTKWVAYLQEWTQRKQHMLQEKIVISFLK